MRLIAITLILIGFSAQAQADEVMTQEQLASYINGRITAALNAGDDTYAPASDAAER